MSGFNVDEKIIKRPADDLPLTEWEEEEWMKCAFDKYYFFENYVYLQGEHGRTLFKPRHYQHRVIDAAADNRFTISLLGRQSGKCCTKFTETLTKVKVDGKLFELPLVMGEIHELSKCSNPDEAVKLLTTLEKKYHVKEKQIQHIQGSTHCRQKQS